MKPKVVVVSDHAVERFMEIFPWYYQLARKDVISILMGVYYSGIEFGGGQRKQDYLILAINRRANEEVVFACAVEDGIGVIKTVLRKDHAVANVQMVKDKKFKKATKKNNRGCEEERPNRKKRIKSEYTEED